MAIIQDPYVRRARITRVIDGDTVRATIDLGWNASIEQNCRLLRVDAPEVRGTERPEGLAAEAFVQAWVDEHAMGSWPFTIRSEKADSFGRYLIELTARGGCNLNDDLLAAGYAADWIPR